MSIVRRTVVRLSRDERMQSIVAAAREVFVERGFDAASTAEIAAKAGVAEGTIYKYFENKRDVLLAVIEAWYQSMIGDFAEQLAGLQGTRNKIYFIVRRHLKSLREDAKLCRLCFNEVRHSDDYYQTPLYEFNRKYTAVFVEVCREGVRLGDLRSDLSVTLFRDLVFGGIDARVSRFLFGVGDHVIDVDATAEEIVRMFYDGVAAQPVSASAGRGVSLSRLDALTDRLERAADRMEAAAPVGAAGQPGVTAPPARGAKSRR
jgi:AcrR family transcriptional regulator